MSSVVILRVLRTASVEDDVYLFDNWPDARKAEEFCKAHLEVNKIEVSISDEVSTSGVTTYKAFKADILMIEDIERDPDPDLTEAQAFLDAARWRGDDEGNDVEIDDLATYFEVAFELLSPEQKAEFLRHDAVQLCLKPALALAKA